MLDVLRTRLRDILFGRTKIKVVSINEEDDVVPVFIIGTFRSGTTLLRYLLDSHSEICSPPETKFLQQISRFQSEKTTADALDLMGLEGDYIKSNLRRLATSMYRPYMESKEKNILVDKTPEYVRCLEFIDWLYEGKAKYILIFRNGLDVAQSMNDQEIEPLEGNKTLDSAFDYWHQDSKTMLSWLEQRPERCHKIVYDELCDDVPEVISSTLEFMGLKWEPQIMEWYAKGHDRGHEDIKARRQRGIVKSKSNYEKWAPEILTRLKEQGREVHSAIGFDPDSLELKA